MVFYNIQNQIIKFTVLLSTILVFVFGSFCSGMLHKASTPATVYSLGISPIASEHCCGDSMTVFQHVQSALNIFLATPRDIGNDDIFLLLILMFTLVFFRKAELDIQKNLKSLRLPFLPNSHPFVSDPLKLAFADGILNTKRY